TVCGKIHRADTSGVDVAYTEWRSDQELLLAGHRGFDTVIGLYNTESAKFTEIWSSQQITTPGRYVGVSGFGDAGDCALIGEGYTRGPEIALIQGGAYGSVKSFDPGYAGLVTSVAVAEQLRWEAADGLGLQGWILRPTSKTPHP